jgi:hypothetical protein
MKLTKGISVRPKRGKFYVYVTYNGQRLAFQFDSEAEATTVAEGYVALKKSGKMAEIFAAPKKEKPEPQAVEKTSPTLADYYKGLPRDLRASGDPRHVRNQLWPHSAATWTPSDEGHHSGRD